MLRNSQNVDVGSPVSFAPVLLFCTDTVCGPLAGETREFAKEEPQRLDVFIAFVSLRAERFGIIRVILNPPSLHRQEVAP